MSYRDSSPWTDKTELMCLLIFKKLQSEDFPRGKQKKYCEKMAENTGLTFNTINAKVGNYKSVAGIINKSNYSKNTVNIYNKYGHLPIYDIELLITT